MLLQAAGLGLAASTNGFTAWALASAILGLGTAMVYPVLIAVIGDVAHPRWRPVSIGSYLFWRDAGGHVVECQEEGAEFHVHGAGHVAFRELARLAYIDNGRGVDLGRVHDRQTLDCQSVVFPRRHAAWRHRMNCAREEFK